MTMERQHQGIIRESEVEVSDGGKESKAITKTRSGFQFNLRKLFYATTLMAAGIGGLNAYQHHAERQRQIDYAKALWEGAKPYEELYPSTFELIREILHVQEAELEDIGTTESEWREECRKSALREWDCMESENAQGIFIHWADVDAYLTRMDLALHQGGLTRSDIGITEKMVQESYIHEAHAHALAALMGRSKSEFDKCKQCLEKAECGPEAMNMTQEEMAALEHLIVGE